MTSTDASSYPPGTVLAGRFVVERTLGAGGMSIVLAARHMPLDRRVALKLLRSEHVASPEIVMRFLREARAVARLTSAHVVAVLDVGTLPTGVPYIVTEYLEGVDLATLSRARGQLAVPDVIEYCFQVLEALAEAHGAGIVHRDLKPANLFLTARADQFPLVKVLDFGISKTLTPAVTPSAELTAPAVVLGSPLYMSPEQLRDAGSVDARTDIWALGVSLYELLAGRPPFEGSSVPAILSAITRERPGPLATLRDDVPATLEAIIERCLAKDPAERYASVQDVAEALRPLATTASSQVSLARIFRAGGSIPPTPITWEQYEAPEAPASVTRAASSELADGTTAPSLEPFQASRPPPRPGRQRLSFAVVLAASAALGFALFELRGLALRESPVAAGGTVAATRPASRAELPEVVIAIPVPSTALPAPASGALVARRSPAPSAVAEARVEDVSRTDASEPAPRALDPHNPFRKR